MLLVDMGGKLEPLERGIKYSVQVLARGRPQNHDTVHCDWMTLVQYGSRMDPVLKSALVLPPMAA